MEITGRGELERRKLRGPFCDGRIPTAPAGGQKGVEIYREKLLHQSHSTLSEDALAVQKQEHGLQAQHRVLRGPGLRIREEKDVLERGRAQILETGIDPFAISPDQTQAFGGAAEKHLSSTKSKLIDAGGTVRGKGCRSEKLRQLSSRFTTLKVHLEKAFLAVKKAQAEG